MFLKVMQANEHLPFGSCNILMLYSVNDHVLLLLSKRTFKFKFSCWNTTVEPAFLASLMKAKHGQTFTRTTTLHLLLCFIRIYLSSNVPLFNHEIPHCCSDALGCFPCLQQMMHGHLFNRSESEHIRDCNNHQRDYKSAPNGSNHD